MRTREAKEGVLQREHERRRKECCNENTRGEGRSVAMKKTRGKGRSVSMKKQEAEGRNIATRAGKTRGSVAMRTG